MVFGDLISRLKIRLGTGDLGERFEVIVSRSQTWRLWFMMANSVAHGAKWICFVFHRSFCSLFLLIHLLVVVGR